MSSRVVSTSYLGWSAIYEINIGGNTKVRVNTKINGTAVRESETLDIGFDSADCVLRREANLRWLLKSKP
ncbi:TOBE domain-containing protein [Mesorhizobium sp. INR15]|uniref:TOBE domain-containing protein n=1 Tax=Mesorhizobium sp. INR15 TaxID=2654248 RepID=UPI0035BBB7FB